MGEQYYIAQIGNMWIKSCHKSIGSLSLTDNKKYAKHLKDEDASWVKENTGVKIIRVNVTITEETVNNLWSDYT
jgi:hypothetical protein